MSGAFTVDRAGLIAAVDDLARFENRLEAAMDDVAKHVNRLHASWSGAAAEEHRAAHAKWTQGMREMHEALRVLRGIADGAHDNYQAAVTANTTMWAL